MLSVSDVPVTGSEAYWFSRLATRARRMTSSAIRELLKVTERPDFISFAGGFPAPELFPIEQINATIQRILTTEGATALQYSATEGYRPLREHVAARLRAQGVPVTVDNVLITTGSQQALDLIGKVLIEPKDPVLVEAPTYLATLQAWTVYGADFRAIPADHQGLQVEGLGALITPETKLLYCIPTFQNPSGSTLSLERRQQLVELATAHRLPIVEDDPYRELRFEGPDLPRLLEIEAAANPSDGSEYRGNIIYLSTYSKVLAPGLRVGYVVAAAPLIKKLVQAKQGSDLHTPTLNQMVAYHLDREGVLDVQARRVAESYKERRDVMLQALKEQFPEGTRCSSPLGGMFLWVTLPDTRLPDGAWRYDTSLLLEKALESRVAFVPGESFFSDHSGHNTLRLNFSNSHPDLIREGVSRLAQALRQS